MKWNIELQQELQQTVERATSPHPADDACLDAESADLRAAWLALVTLLPSTTESVSETDVWARIAARDKHDLRTPARLASRVKGPRHWRTVAAAVLVALSSAAILWRPDKRPQFANPHVPNSSPGVDPIFGSEPTWSDPLEDDFAAAQRGIAQLQSGWQTSASAAENLGHQIEELLLTVESETL
jgi:hypothetical protein